MTDNEDDAFTFFDSQNNRGVQPSAVDVLKAVHLRAIHTDENLQKESACLWEKTQNVSKNIFRNKPEEYLNNLIVIALWRLRTWKGSLFLHDASYENIMHEFSEELEYTGKNNIKVYAIPSSYELLIDSDMKVKMENIFYRYGMIGLERLDEALEDVIDEIMNPEPVVIERPVPAPQPEKPVVKKRKRRVVRKPIQTQTNEATEDVEPDEVLVDPRKSLNDLDINDLGAILGKETKEYKTEAQKKTEQLLNAYGNEMEAEQQKVQEAQAATEAAEIQQPEDIPDEPLEVIGENEEETAE